eukprot:799651-Pyramimonas_sp.AAC.1
MANHGIPGVVGALELDHVVANTTLGNRNALLAEGGGQENLDIGKCLLKAETMSLTGNPRTQNCVRSPTGAGTARGTDPPLPPVEATEGVALIE